MSERHFVAWSGGLDSTLIVKALIDKNINFEAIVFRVPEFGQSKYESEVVARYNLMKEFGRVIPTTVIDIVLPFGYQSRGDFEARIIQQPLMVSHSAFILPNNSVIHFGYHAGDSFFSFDREIMDSTETLLKVLGDKKVRYSFPLKYMDKLAIVKRMDSLGLLELCHWCETPEQLSQCGKCTPCTLMRETQDTLKSRKKRGYQSDLKLVFEFERQKHEDSEAMMKVVI